ncbi:hypothetical protein niasHT_025569 [Heterodera trifolii]|uniref:N-acetyltransferase domain-containing protein n=1 Tax=Heterodera trifolii TaxID=157864 RepID=A0ABD2K892_9BILA
MPFSSDSAGASQSTVSSSSTSSSSTSFVNNSKAKPAKLLQVDIFPLSLPPRGDRAGAVHGCADAENGGVVADGDVGGVSGGGGVAVVHPPRSRRDAKSESNDDNENGGAAAAAADDDDTLTEEEQMLARQFSKATSLFDVEVPLFSDDQSGHPRPTATDRRRVRIDRYRDGALPDIMRLIGRELSEPYSVYTYLYFIHQWPDLCVLAIDCADEQIVGAILCKLDRNALDERDCILSRGYIGMLAVEESYRGHGIGTRLIRTVIELLRRQGCNEVLLETEVSNARSLSLYGRLGFIRDARLYRYYLNGGDAFRLKLFLEQQPQHRSTTNDYHHHHHHHHHHNCYQHPDHDHHQQSSSSSTTKTTTNDKEGGCGCYDDDRFSHCLSSNSSPNTIQ